MRNPFHHRQAITDAGSFYGRSGVARNLLEMMASGQSCALVGERRIGKSSLLRYLLDPRVRAAHDLDPRTLMAHLDFLAFHTISPEELWLEILEALLATARDSEARAILEPLAAHRPLPFAELRRALRRLSRLGWRVVLLCDEFELAVQNPRFDVGLFGALRSLAGSEGVVFVTASRLGLFELDQYRSEEARRKILGSPFFNIFAEFSLGPFDDHEMAELVAASLEPTLIRFDTGDVAWLDRVAGRHPYFLQLAAYHLYAALEKAGLASEPISAISDVRRIDCRAVAREELAREAVKIFRNLWQHSNENEKAALGSLAAETQVARLRASLRGERSTFERLVRRGLLVKRPPDRRENDSTSTRELSLERYRLFSEVLGEWLRSEGLVGEARADDSAEMTAPAIAELLPARYSVLEEIGQGSAGSVFKAWDERLQRVVAVKALNQTVRDSPERLGQLLGEARLCAALNHPHIVTVYDVDVEHACLITEFFAGGSLRDLLDHSPILSIEDLAALAEQLAGALAAAHRAGVVHRDLKPENVLLTMQPSPRGTINLPLVKLADFGTAQRLSGLPEGAGAIAGTLAYMAPEQRAGREAGPAADLYSLGVVLFEARHGHRPGAAWIDNDDTSSELTPLGRVSHLEGRARELSHRLDTIIARCLRPLPEERFASAEELLAGLRGGGPV